MKTAARFLCLALIGSLAACGGGSSSGSGAVTPVPTALVTLDKANASTVSGAVIQASNIAYNLGRTGSAVVQGLSLGPAAGAFSLAKFAKWQLIMLRGMTGHLSAAGLGTLPAAKVPCDQNQGSVSVTSSTVGSGGAPTPGDSYSVSFIGCFIQDTQSRLDGSLTLSIVSFNGNPLTASSWSMSAKFSFNNLSSTDATGASVFSGGYDFSLSTGDGVTYNGVIQSDSFTETHGKTVQGLRHLSVNYSLDSNTEVYTVSLNGLYGSTALNGAVNFDSEVSLSGQGKGWPTTGRLKISGAGNTSVTVVPAPPNGAQLGVDSNGDGTPDDTLSVNWAVLVGA